METKARGKNNLTEALFQNPVIMQIYAAVCWCKLNEHAEETGMNHKTSEIKEMKTEI